MAFKPKKKQPVAQVKTPVPAVAAPVAPAKSDDRFMPKLNKPVKDLPSAGKAYPAGTEIKYRPYSFGEIKTINQSELSTKEKILEILKGVGGSTSFDTWDLTLQDTFFLGFSRKRATFLREDKVVLPHHCEGCDRRSDFTLREDKDLDFDWMPAPKLPVTISLFGEDFSFMPLTVRRYFDLLDKLAKAIDDGQALDGESAMMAAQCSSHTFEEAYKACLNSTDSNENDDLVAVESMLQHELKPVTFKCANMIETDDGKKPCGHESTLRLDEVGRLVLPFRPETGKTPEARLRFGVPGRDVRDGNLRS